MQYIKAAYLKRIVYFLVIFLGIFSIKAQDWPVFTIDTAYVSWSPNGDFIAVATEDKINIIELSSNEVKNTFTVSRFGSQPVSWNEQQELIAFSNYPSFEIWRNPTEISTLELSFPVLTGSHSWDWYPDGKIIAVGDGETTNIWNINTQTKLASISLGLTAGGIWSLDWNKNGDKLLIANERFVAIFNYNTQSVETIFSISPFVNPKGFYINPTARSTWSPSEEQIAIGSDDAVRVLTLSDYVDQEFVTLAYDTYFFGHEGAVYCVDWHPSGQYLASSGEDSTIRIWDVETKEEINRIEFPENTIVRSVAWSPDGTQLAYGSPTGEADVVLVDSVDILPEDTQN